MTTELNVKAVRRIVVLQQDPAGGYAPVTVYRKNKKRKKQSRLVKPLEKRFRKLSDAAATMTESYNARHRRSNEKKKNGWIKDLSKNVRKAARKGRKSAKLKKAFSL
jgi:hypothetical protein